MLSHNQSFAIVVLAAALAAFAARPAVAQSDRIQRILRETPLIDGHNDVPENIAGRFKSHLEAIDFAAGTATLVAADAHRHPAAEGRRGWRAILVGVGAGPAFPKPRR